MLHRFQLLGAAMMLALAAPAWAENVVIALENTHQAEVDAGFEALVAGHHKEAEKAFSQVIKAYEKSHSDGKTYRCADDLDDAAKVSILSIAQQDKRDLTILGPGWCLALFGKGFVLIDLNRSGEAGGYLARAVEMAPTQAHYINEYAEWHKSRRDWQRSYALFAQAWEVVGHDKAGPDRKVAARALRGMGFNQIELGELDEAERRFKQSQEYEPDSAAAKNELEYIARLRATRDGDK